MGTCGKPGYVFRDFCLKQAMELIICCLNQGIDLSIFAEQDLTVTRMRQRDRMHVLVKHWLMVGPCNGSYVTHLMD